MSKQDNKLRITVIQQAPAIGGAETYMYSLIEYFKKNGHMVSVITDSHEYAQFLSPLKIKVFHAPMTLDVIGNYRGLIKSFFLLPYACLFYIKLLSYLKRQKVDLIFMSGFSEKMLVTFLSQFFTLPVVWLEHGPLKTIFTRNFYLPLFIYTKLARIAKVIVVPSNNTRMSLVQDGKIDKKKIIHIPDGITIPNYNLDKSVSGLDSLKNKFIIGNVSRMTREKGQQYIINAMPNILKKVPNAHLLLIGAGFDKIFFEEIVHKLHMEEHVTFTGFVDTISPYYSLMDIFVFPTVWDLEGFGLVTIEAMSYKIPVIANNTLPVSEIIKDGQTGRLVDVTDISLLTEAIVDLAKHKEKRRMFGENGYQEIKKKYTITKAAAAFLDLFVEVTKSNRSEF